MCVYITTTRMNIWLPLDLAEDFPRDSRSHGLSSVEVLMLFTGDTSSGREHAHCCVSDV
jgi:hypothetical protein